MNITAVNKNTPAEQRSELVQWLKALASGLYTQTFGKEHYVDGEGNEKFCALGVLDRAVWTGVRAPCGRVTIENERVYLAFDDELEMWAYEPIDRFVPMRLRRAIIALNDGMKLPFAEIATLVGNAFDIDPSEYLPDNSLAEALFRVEEKANALA